MIYHCIIDSGQILWLSGVDDEEEKTTEHGIFIADVKKQLLEKDRSAFLCS